VHDTKAVRDEELPCRPAAETQDCEEIITFPTTLNHLVLEEVKKASEWLALLLLAMASWLAIHATGGRCFGT
jgi:hypothetical protein